MSKIAEEAALKAYPEKTKVLWGPLPGANRPSVFDDNLSYRTGFIKGYEQAEKDMIKKIREQVECWMPDNPEGDEHISGERVAFRSVLVLLKEMQESMEDE